MGRNRDTLDIKILATLFENYPTFLSICVLTKLHAYSLPAHHSSAFQQETLFYLTENSRAPLILTCKTDMDL